MSTTNWIQETAPMSPEPTCPCCNRKDAVVKGEFEDSPHICLNCDCTWHPERRASLAPAEAEHKDAERYRWLREQPHFDVAACWFLPASLKAVASVTTIEDAIDAAMKETGCG